MFTIEMTNRIKEIDKKNDDRSKPLLIILKGFYTADMRNLVHNKLFNTSIDQTLTELIEAGTDLLIESTTKERSQNLIYWCTFEEYLTVGKEVLERLYVPSILLNNVFHNTFPLNYSLDDQKPEVLNYLRDQDQHLDEERFSVSTLQNYIGNLEQINNKWFVTYIDDSYDEKLFNQSYSSITIGKASTYDNFDLEFSEDETPFLEIVDQLLQTNGKKHYLLSFSGDLSMFSNEYKQRLEILQYLNNSVSFELFSKELLPKYIDDIPYKNILQKYWGYDNFRELDIYENINDLENPKKTTTITQAQVIDDIVKQSNLARSGEPYKDIFVTAPTGAGKSLMFQIPALYLAEQQNLMTIIISPLIGLMKDQVESLTTKNVKQSATINSELSPVQKNDIRNKIEDNEISILYISPETLLSRSDIQMLIGDRQVGLFVVDEAHIVTTWGKAFRSDYWYLGHYISRLRKEMKFPIATFTATAIYGGIEDMYAETRDSLKLINPISYFGYIKRDNILMSLESKSIEEEKRFQEYMSMKNKMMLMRLEGFLKKGEKTLVYFPMVKNIHQFYDYLKIYGSTELRESLGLYYGYLNKEDKEASYEGFKKGSLNIMLATKAFGMGIDIPDIKNVYHFAPTGNVCDYIQEIGRAARDLPTGKAYFDFLPKDFSHINRLHGISTIKKYQLIQVLEKINNMVTMNASSQKNIRNLLINSEEFRYIFESSGKPDQDEIDNKLKTALLIIEKDFVSKMDYSPILARPRSIFTYEFFKVLNENKDLVLKQLKGYCSVLKANNSSTLLKIDLKRLWEDHHDQISFPKFKYLLHQEPEKINLQVINKCTAVVKNIIKLNQGEVNSLSLKSNQVCNIIEEFFAHYATTNKYFKLDDLCSHLQRHLKLNSYRSKSLANMLIDTAFGYVKTINKRSNIYRPFIKYHEATTRYSIQNTQYADFINWIDQETNYHTKYSEKSSQDELTIYYSKNDSSQLKLRFLYLGLMEAFGHLVYKIEGGDSPEIFIRINSKYQIERTLKSPHLYENRVLSNVYNRHKMSVLMLTYLFKNQFSTDQFWDLIEDYFLGIIPEEVKEEYYSKAEVTQISN